MTPAAHRVLILIAAFLFSTGGAAVKATTLSPWQVAGFQGASPTFDARIPDCKNPRYGSRECRWA